MSEITLCYNRSTFLGVTITLGIVVGILAIFGLICIIVLSIYVREFASIYREWKARQPIGIPGTTTRSTSGLSSTPSQSANTVTTYMPEPGLVPVIVTNSLTN